MKKTILLFMCVFLLTNQTNANKSVFWSALSVKNPELKNDTFSIFEIDNQFIRIDFINPSVYRIRINNQNKFPEGGMEKYGIINAQCQGHKVTKSTKGNTITYSSEKSKLSLTKKDGSIIFYNDKVDILTQNKVSIKVDPEQGFKLSFKLDPQERLYGFGDESRDSIQKKGRKNKMVITNVVSYVPIPYVMSSKGWGLFLNTTMYHSFDAGATNRDMLSFTSDYGYVDYFLIIGNSMPDLLDNYTSITGKPTLLPKWGYGLTYICDERGVKARDVLYEAYGFRRQEIPCDVIGLEPDWMEKEYDFSIYKQWSKERFHIPEWQKGPFDHALENMNFKLSLWLCIDYDFSEYEELQIRDGEIKAINDFENEGIADYTNTGAASIYLDTLTKPGVPWFDHLKKFVDDGAAAFKMDASNQVHFHPDRKWKNGMEDYEMHNLYPLLYSKQMNQGFREYTGKRAMLYTAAGYSGIQRYAATWAGDTGGGEKTLVSLLNHGLSGHSNVCTDMEVQSGSGIHFGFFQTLPVNLSWWQFNQPWFLGDHKAALFKNYAILRYSLIPYIYSMAHIAAQNAMPVMRALPLIYPEDRKCDDYIHQYMFGDAFLVSAFDSMVYLPKGEWIDYWTGKRLQGKREIPAEYPDDKGGPLFVKVGSIIPTQKVESHIGTKTPENICWDIYPGGDSKFTLYEDDGETYKYLEGEIAKTLLQCQENNGKIHITIDPRKGNYDTMPKLRTHSLKIHYPGKLSVENPEVSWSYNEDGDFLSIDKITETNKAIELTINVH